MTHPFFIYPCQWSYITWLVGILLRATIAHDRDPSYIWRYALHADACWLPSDNRSRWRLTLRTTLFSYLLEYDLVEVIGFQMVIYNAWVRSAVTMHPEGVFKECNEAFSNESTKWGCMWQLQVKKGNDILCLIGKLSLSSLLWTL